MRPASSERGTRARTPARARAGLCGPQRADVGAAGFAQAGLRLTAPDPDGRRVADGRGAAHGQVRLGLLP